MVSCHHVAYVLTQRHGKCPVYLDEVEDVVEVDEMDAEEPVRVALTRSLEATVRFLLPLLGMALLLHLLCRTVGVDVALVLGTAG